MQISENTALKYAINTKQNPTPSPKQLSQPAEETQKTRISTGTEPVVLSGKSIMLSRLFLDAKSEPPIQTHFTTQTMHLPKTHFLTREDRNMLSDLYAEAKNQNIALGYIDDLASDLANYRQIGNLQGNLNDGTMFDTQGYLQTFSFTEKDSIVAERILKNSGSPPPPLDSAFLNHTLDPGYNFSHRTNFEFLEQVINRMSQGNIEPSKPFDQKFSTYTPQLKENFKIELSEEIILQQTEPDFGSKNGVFHITETGMKNGFQIIDGKPVQKIDFPKNSMIESLRLAGTEEKSIASWWKKMLLLPEKHLN